MQPVNVPEGLEVLDAIEDVSVRLTAPADLWERLSPKEFEAVVDLNGFGTGEHMASVRVGPKDARVKVLEVIPSKVRVNMDALGKKDVPVRLNIAGLPPDDFTTGQPYVAPEHVGVMGPRSLVSLVEEAVADVDLTGLRTDFRQFVELKLRTSAGYEVRKVRLERGSVLVEIPIVNTIHALTLPLVPDVQGAPSVGYSVGSVVLDPPVITVLGSKEALEGLTYLSTESINISGAVGTVERITSLELPEGVIIPVPNRVRIRIEVVKGREIATFRVVPRVEGLAAGRRAIVGVSSVEVTVAGDPVDLRAISPEQLLASVRVAGLGVGRHSVEITVRLPERLSFIGAAPKVIDVQIQ